MNDKLIDKSTDNVWRRIMRSCRKNWQLFILCIPALTGYIIFRYVPMFGVVMAFKDYKYNKGIWGSDWCGFDNFLYILKYGGLARITRNTVFYSLTFLIVGTIIGVASALLLYEINNKASLKLYQTCIQLPRFMSWVVVGFITYAILNPSYGILNQVLTFFGKQEIDVYTKASYWPLILTICNSWKGLGGNCIMYYAALMAIDPSLYEAARIDGASRWKQTLYISIPHLVSLMTILTIMSIGSIFSGDFGLFYQIPRDVGALYETTDIINTYTFRALQDANYTAGSAVGLMQNVLGMIMVLLTNGVVRKIAPENAMF